MQELIHNFGIDPYLLVAQIVNFLIILIILRKFAYKPILQLLEKRRQTIAEGLKQAEESKKALENAVEKEKEILKNAQTESKKLLAEANTQADSIITKAQEKGRLQAEKLLSDTRETLSQERKQLEKDLAVKVTQLATDMLQKSLEGFFDQKQQKEVLEKVTKKLRT